MPIDEVVRSCRVGLHERALRESVHGEEPRRNRLAAVRRIYRHFDLPLSDAAERAMRQYLASEPKDGHGRHVYSLADFGLDAERERERNRAYLERFGCRRDGDGAVA